MIIEGNSQALDYYGTVILYMYYPNHSFLSEHILVIEEDDWREHEIISSCTQKYSRLAMWPQNQYMDIEDISSLGISYIYSEVSSYESYKPLAKVSNYSIEEFYELFFSVEEKPCIEFSTYKIVDREP